MDTKTKFFQNCLGVFQGGGCKGIAYAGAYEVAYNRGVSFSSLVGTSAGSIVAALIAAGATPVELNEIMAKIDYTEFLRAPVNINSYKPPTLPWYVKYLKNKYIVKGLPFIKFLGIYNSGFIKEWLELEMRKLLGIAKGPICFEHLKIPLYIVSTDLKSNKPYVWDYFKDKSADVCEAVQASCTIPFFFQTLNERFVDGGLLSNLPAYIFQDDANKFFNKILAFTLKSKESNEAVTGSIGTYLGSIINTTIEGATDVRLGLLDNVYTIGINTGDISSTDFTKMSNENISTLVQAGKNAANLFFNNETIQIARVERNPYICRQSFQTYNFIVETNNEIAREIIIIDNNTDWVYTIFPSLIFWIRNKTKIEIILTKEGDRKDHGAYRRRFLVALGLNISFVSDIPFRGFLFDGGNKDSCKAIVFNYDFDGSSSYHSKYYFGERDYYAIGALRSVASSLITSASLQHSQFSPTIESVDFKELEAALKTIPQYSGKEIYMELKEVDVEEIQFITRFVKGFKYKQISIVFDLFQTFGIRLFASAKLKLLGDKYTLITPPIIEKHGDSLILIEGNTRIFYALKNKISKMSCVVIHNVTASIPSGGDYKKKDLLLIEKDLRGDGRYPDFNKDDYRKIEKAVRNPINCLT